MRLSNFEILKEFAAFYILAVVCVFLTFISYKSMTYQRPIAAKCECPAVVKPETVQPTKQVKK
jgi:hypothetical protein